MDKGLKALERNRNFIERYFVKQVEETGVYRKNMKDEILNDLKVIEKELKALEIIKKNTMVKYIEWYSLTQEERDLLKEISL